MRATFLHALAELAAEDDRIALLTGDLGFGVVDDFAERFPDRFFNAGVAEQNMVGVATGLAEAGHVPFVYSIATFASLRPFEFIRNGPVLQALPVRIVAVGGGFEYSGDGPSHYALEDVALMRSQPGMCVIAPADPTQVTAAVRAHRDVPGPIYYRLGKDETRRVPGLDGRFALGRCETIGNGGDVLIVTSGSVSTNAVAAAELLEGDGVGATVLVVSTLSPPPLDDLAAALARYESVVTVEAHYVNGGLGSLVCEVVAERGLGCRVGRCAVRGLDPGLSGSEAYLHDRHGLSAANVAATARELHAGAVRRDGVV